MLAMVMRFAMLTTLLIQVLPLLALATWGMGCTASAPSTLPTTLPDTVQVRTVLVEFASGTTNVDLYYTDTLRPLPLVIVAHGFSRSKANMAGWGRALAEAGFIAAVPDLPAWSDHARNGRFINELIGHLAASPPEGIKVDGERIGLLGFSAGGLATLLAAAGNPVVRVWVGLDPVDKNGQGVAAAPRLRCRAAILRAEPSSCNANGNAAGIERALKVPCLSIMVPKATHADPEWPTDKMAEWVCGASAEERRATFVRHALAVLAEALLGK